MMHAVAVDLGGLRRACCGGCCWAKAAERTAAHATMQRRTGRRGRNLNALSLPGVGHARASADSTLLEARSDAAH